MATHRPWLLQSYCKQSRYAPALHLPMFVGPNNASTAVLSLLGVLNPVVPMKYALLHHILLWMHLSSFANSIAFAKGQTRYMSSTSTSLQLVGNAGEFDLHHFRLVCLIMLGYLQPLDVANASQLLQDSRLPGGG